MTTWTQYLLQAARTLRKKPVGSAAVLLTLTLGVGINTAIFSALRGLLLRPLPYPRAEEIVRIWPERPVSQQSFVFFESMARSFSALSAFGHQTLPLAGAGSPEELAVGEVAPAHFDVLGVRPYLGRGFYADERRPDRANVVILSYGLWQRRFGGDAGIVGKTVSLGGRDQVVVGVMPEGYRPLQAGWEAWIPLIVDWATDRYRAWTGYRMIGRLASGTAVESSQSEVQSIVARLHEMDPARINEAQARQATVVPLAKLVLGDIGLSLLILQGTAGLVLLVGCANVANVLIAQNLSRQRELAVRSVLGASRGRLVRQLLAEGLFLGLASGFLGVLFAGWTLKALRGTLASLVPRHEEIRLDLGVLGFALAVSLVSVLGSCLLPALRAAGPNLQAALTGAGPTTPSRERWRLSHGLTALEISLSVVLVIGASLLAKSFWKLRQEPLGFETAGVQTFKLRPPSERYGDETRRAQFFQQVLERLSGVSGIDAAGAVNVLPLAGGDLRAPLLTHGQEVVPGEMPPLVSFRVVTPDALRALEVPLLQGRTLTAADRSGALNVGLVNQALARAVWPGADPMGEELLRPDGNPWFTVVGVVGDTRFTGLDVKPEPQVYLPLAQNTWPSEMFFVVRMQRPLGGQGGGLQSRPAPVEAPLESAVWSVDDEVPVSQMAPLADLVRESLGTERRLVGLLAALAGLALVLAAVGVYGVTSHTIDQRRYETGVRMAFGATATSVVRTAVGRLVPSIAVGLLAGTAGAFGLTRFLARFLYDVNPTDLLVFGAVLLFLGGWALLVGYLPARRAAAVDPVVVLRAE